MATKNDGYSKLIEEILKDDFTSISIFKGKDNKLYYRYNIKFIPWGNWREVEEQWMVQYYYNNLLNGDKTNNC